MLMFSSCNPKLFAFRHIHYPVNPSSDHVHTDAVMPSIDHCRTEAVLPPSDHYCIATLALSGDHTASIVVPFGDHYCIDIGYRVVSIGESPLKCVFRKCGHKEFILKDGIDGHVDSIRLQLHSRNYVDRNSEPLRNILYFVSLRRLQ